MKKKEKKMSEASEDCQLNIDANYDLGLHIGSIFVIGAFSFLGTVIPLVLKKYFSMSSLIFQSAKLVGAGVILSTAFNHLLAESFETLTSPCSGIDFFALAGVCALMGVLFTLIVQLIASEALTSVVARQETDSATATLNNGDDLSHNNHTNDILNGANGASSREVECLGDIKIIQIGESAVQDDSCRKIHSHPAHIDSGHDHSHGGLIVHSNRVTAYLLELGIGLHSVLIGISLGLARDEFTSLFIALVFHQFFEGIGLSSVVSEAKFSKKWIAIGLVVFCNFSGLLIIFRHSVYSNWNHYWNRTS